MVALLLERRSAALDGSAAITTDPTHVLDHDDFRIEQPGYTSYGEIEVVASIVVTRAVVESGMPLARWPREQEICVSATVDDRLLGIASRLREPSQNLSEIELRGDLVVDADGVAQDLEGIVPAVDSELQRASPSSPAGTFHRPDREPATAGEEVDDANCRTGLLDYWCGWRTSQEGAIDAVEIRPSLGTPWWICEHARGV